MTLQILSFLSFALAVFCYTVSQMQIHAKLEKWGHFWIRHSWKFKYKTVHDDPVLAPRNWYYKVAGVIYKERFPLSSTLLVAFTDGYHLMQFLFKLLFCISVVTYSMDFSWWMALSYFLIWGGVFTITYKLLSR